MFQDRFDAARQLVAKLQDYKNNTNVVVLAIPRGGLELGSVLAKELHVPLDVVLVKKIGFPLNPEYAIGAVGLTHEIINHGVEMNLSLVDYIKQEIPRLRELLKERAKQYHGEKKPISLHGKTVIIVDDGVATGSTLMAALAIIKQEEPAKIVVALPVGPRDTITKLQGQADEVVCVLVPQEFRGVGQFYRNFDQVEDAVAIKLFKDAQQ